MTRISLPRGLIQAETLVEEREADLKDLHNKTIDTLRDAREHAKEARGVLAEQIRKACPAIFGPLDDLHAEVATRLGLAPRTVRNALRETFQADILTACLDVLDEVGARRQDAA